MFVHFMLSLLLVPSDFMMSNADGTIDKPFSSKPTRCITASCDG